MGPRFRGDDNRVFATSLRRELNRAGPVTGPPVARREDTTMTLLKWALIFLVISLIAALFGFGGIAAASADIARILFYIFIVIFLVLLILGLLGARAARGP